MFSNECPNGLLSDIFVELPEKRDERGSLTFVQYPDVEFKRAFWIYNVPEGAKRGGHAHNTCYELVFALHGALDIELYDGKERVVVHLDHPRRGIIIRPRVWCTLFNFSKNFVGLCLASHEYQPEGYICDIDML